ncbi:MAG: HNH endonuclease [Spirochaetaceae bacterium]|nr:MAG: HNH endonuclease [Spirochaetaceae bacterium]
MSEVLASHVLVLNRGYSPIRTTTVRDAFVKLFASVAEAVAVEDGAYVSYDFHSWVEVSLLRNELNEAPPEADWIHTPSLSLIVPRVIRLLDYDRLPVHSVKLTRKNIYERDRYTCQYTGRKLRPADLNIDHVIPRSQGGRNTWENLVTCSVDANSRKGGRTPREAGMKLIRKPIRPAPRHQLKLPTTNRRYRDWDHFVSDLYWNAELDED